MHQSLRRVTRGASLGLTWFSYAVLLIMMAHITADVLFKYFLNQPIQGTLEIVANYYMIGVVLLPLPLVELDDRNVQVELISRLLPDWGQRWSLATVLLVSAAFYAVLAYRTGIDAMAAFDKGEVVMGAVSVITWPGRFILPAAFALAVVVSLLRIPQALTLPGRGAEPGVVDPNAVYE
jgi:TRAP-type C4-dicarboxylate transport system permease small subunit